MDLISIIILSFALALDAFSISITWGLTLKVCKIKQALWIALFFGGFQAIMPILGWIAGIRLQLIISQLAPWVAFLLLLAIGLKMIYESIKMEEEAEPKCNIFSFKKLFVLAIATSIDAFAVGVTFALLSMSIWFPIVMIGLITFLLSLLGVYAGKKIGHLFESKIEILGGIILILLGFKILIEHLLSL